MKVIMIRLAECHGNVQKLVAKHGNLTSLGRQQAQALADKFRKERLAACFSSNATAAFQTAKILIENHGISIITDKAFNEPKLGDWEGLTFEQIKSKWPKEWDEYLNPGDDCRERRIVPGNSETWGETIDKVLNRLKELAKQYIGKTIAIVTHGEVVRLVVLSLLQAPIRNIWNIRGFNGAVTIFKYDGVTVVFEVINDISHLNSLDKKDLWDYIKEA